MKGIVLPSSRRVTDAVTWCNGITSSLAMREEMDGVVKREPQSAESLMGIIASGPDVGKEELLNRQPRTAGFAGGLRWNRC